MIARTLRRTLRPFALRGGLFAAVLATLSLAASAGTASAVSCYGDYCSGKDPQATGCAADGGMARASYIWDSAQGRSRKLELRWSPTCKTTWARIQIANESWFGPTLPKYLWVTQEKTNYTQWYVSNNGTWAWTRQIYSPRLCAWAGATLKTGAKGTTACW